MTISLSCGVPDIQCEVQSASTDYVAAGSFHFLLPFDESLNEA